MARWLELCRLVAVADAGTLQLFLGGVSANVSVLSFSVRLRQDQQSILQAKTSAALAQSERLSCEIVRAWRRQDRQSKLDQSVARVLNSLFIDCRRDVS